MRKANAWWPMDQGLVPRLSFPSTTALTLHKPLRNAGKRDSPFHLNQGTFNLLEMESAISKKHAPSYRHRPTVLNLNKTKAIARLLQSYFRESFFRIENFEGFFLFLAKIRHHETKKALAVPQHNQGCIRSRILALRHTCSALPPPLSPPAQLQPRFSTIGGNAAGETGSSQAAPAFHPRLRLICPACASAQSLARPHTPPRQTGRTPAASRRHFAACRSPSCRSPGPSDPK